MGAEIAQELVHIPQDVLDITNVHQDQITDHPTVDPRPQETKGMFCRLDCFEDINFHLNKRIKRKIFKNN